MHYEIDSQTYAISFYNPPQVEPYQWQPNYPNGDSFDSLEEAKAWAEASIAAHSPQVLQYAPQGKGLEGERKPDPEAKAKLLAKLGISAEEAALLFR